MRDVRDGQSETHLRFTSVRAWAICAIARSKPGSRECKKVKPDNDDGTTYRSAMAQSLA